MYFWKKIKLKKIINLLKKPIRGGIPINDPKNKIKFILKLKVLSNKLNLTDECNFK